jgi:subtilisin family serine protease
MMRRLTRRVALAGAAGMLAAMPLAAQLQVPGAPVSVPPVGGVLGNVTDRLDQTVGTATALAEREARRLVRLRAQSLERLLRANPQTIERDLGGNLARRGELLASGATDAQVRLLEAAGFRVTGREDVEGLGIAFVRLAVPARLSLAEAQKRVAAIAPGLEVEADTLHFEAGAKRPSRSVSLPMVSAAQASATAVADVRIGVIDGGAAKAVAVAAQKGFAIGAPRPSDHGSAVASLLKAHSAAPVLVADVYGTDPAGGNASAIVKALGWLAASGCKVVTVSLVGPRSALVERAVAAARGKGVVVLAAVGNDGPAAPPAYPASYAGVLAITGVDRKGRALIEAGRALHLDYAAPGAEVYAMDARGRTKAYRGTSFAAPLAATRVAAAMMAGSTWRSALDREARDLGAKGPDRSFGRGVLCEGCGRKR